MSDTLNSDDQPSPQEQEQRTNQVIALLKHLFHVKFCVAEEIDERKKAGVLPLYFYSWLNKNINLMDAVEVCEAAKVPEEIWSWLVDVIDSNLAVERLAQVWYPVILAGRPEPEHKVSRVALTALIFWEDGRIIPVSAFVDKALVEGGNFTDGMVAGIIQRNMNHFVTTVAEDSLDQLYAKGDDYRGTVMQDPFEIFMGTMLKVIPQMPKEYHEGVMKYLRLFQGIIRSPIPPQAQAHAQQHRIERDEAKGKVTGGWDV